jgi:hypothetical protein
MISALWRMVLDGVVLGGLICGRYYLVADDSGSLFVEEDWNGEAASVVWVLGEVDITQVGEVFVQGVGNGVLARQVLVGSSEAPS